MTVLQITGLEWYDGWLASLIETEDARFASCAVAWDCNQGRRRFALFPVTNETAKRLEDLCGDNGYSADFNEAWGEVISGGNAYLMDYEPLMGASIETVKADHQQVVRLRSYLLPVVDVVFSDEAISFWLNTNPRANQ